MRKFFFFFLLSLSFTLIGTARTIDLDLRGGPVLQSTALQAVPAEKGVLRRTVLTAGAADVRGLAVGDRLSLKFYSDVDLELTLVEREESPFSAPVFQAVVEGADGLRDAVVIETDAGLYVNARRRANGCVYSVVSSSANVTVKEVDPTAEPTVDGGTREPDLTLADAAAATLLAADQPASVVDMLVAYDQGAATWARANGGITNLAQQCVARMNTALANSGIASLFRFRLVGVMSVAADGEGDLDTTLEAVRAGTGDWSEIKAMRETVGADVVCTMIDTGSAYGTTGLGYSLQATTTSGMAAFANSAYNVISVRAAAQSHVMTHETGHNMGAGHSDRQTSSPGPQSFDYSRGFYFTGTDDVAYHTIMAYNSDGYGNTYESAPLFSSPSVTWQGSAAGDDDHDNVQVLCNTFAAVAAFRAQKIALSYDVFFSPESGATFSGSTQVTLTPGKSGLTIRYTTDGSTPTATYGTVYSGPITLTAATTIKAVTITDGVAGPVYEASYYPSDLGYALNAPQLTWTTSFDTPWTTQSTNTYDGALAVQSASPFPVTRYYNETTWLKTTVTGPTKMSFRYSQRCNTPGFEVSIDGQTTWGPGTENWGEWQLVEVDIPAGSHEVKFSWTLLGSYWTGFNGVVLDTVQFDVLSRPPTIAPASTADAATATVFTNSLSVVLTPGTAGGMIRYTLDGSDPSGDNGLIYAGPLTLTTSTRVRAVEVDAGKEPSAELDVLYLERHPLAAGEWTTDVAGARAAAAQDGKLICVLLANLSTCSWCKAFDPVANSKTFLSWAKTNGVYLVSADSSAYLDADEAYDWFWDLYSSYGDSGGVGYPTMYFALPSAPETAVGKGVARAYGSTYSIGSVTYTGTVESLIAGIASVLSANGVTPIDTTVSVADILETSGVAWTNASSVPWREEYPCQMRAGGLMDSTYSSVLSAKVSGKGTFIFSYRTTSYTWQNTFAFAVDGEQQWSYAYDGATVHAGTVTNDVTSASGATFTWTYSVQDASRDYGAGYSNPCGAWIYDVQWIPADAGVTRLDGQGNAVTIPNSWFTEHGLSAADADGDADGDGLCNWHEYVCGTDPRNSSSVLQCTISVVDGVPTVDYAPKSGYRAGYRAVVKGRASLTTGSWGSPQSTHRFFKVFLEK